LGRYLSGVPSDIVFIHGMYMNSASWQPWVAHAAARGLIGHAPSWPYHDGDPSHLRTHVDPGLGRLNLGAVVRHMAGYIETLPAPPVLIGHSVGGLVVQRLINDGYGLAGVSISPAPPLGVLSFSPHFVRANFPHVNPFAGNRPVHMTPARFHYTFCNTMSRADSDEAFERYVVPESRNVPRATLTPQARVDFRRRHAPLLIIAGDRDHLTPATMVRRNAAAYKATGGRVDLREFSHRSHFICNQDGWEEVADACLDWLSAAG
jgi:pimeloyl-ACP methyl ester carboxylesterase